MGSINCILIPILSLLLHKTNGQAGISPQLYIHQGHIGLRDRLPPNQGLTPTSIQIGAPYTFEVLLMDTTSYDYMIESCVLNGQERFMVDYGCLHCTSTFLQVWETEAYGRTTGSVKRTLVHLVANSDSLNFECTIKVYRCCACAEKSCVRRPFLGTYPCETIQLNLYVPPGGGGGGSSYYTKGVQYDAIHDYAIGDQYGGGGGGYIPPPLPLPHDSAQGGGVIVHHSSGHFWGLPWWLWLIIFLLLLLLLLCCLALCCWLCFRKRAMTKKKTTVITPPPPPPARKTVTSAATSTENNVGTMTVHEEHREARTFDDGNLAVIAGGAATSAAAHHSRRDYSDMRERRDYEREFEEDGAVYNVNTGRIGHYKKHRSRSPHNYASYDDQELREDRYYEEDSGRRSRNSVYNSNDSTMEMGHRNEAYVHDLSRHHSSGNIVAHAGGYDELTRTNREFDHEDDEFIVDKEVKTTTTTKYIEERRIIDDDEDKFYPTPMTIPHISVNHSERRTHYPPPPSPSEENYREETVRRALYTHSVPV